MDQHQISWTASSRSGHNGRNVPDNNDCLAFNKTALYTSALRSDISDLMEAYKENDSMEYTPFATLWKSRQFSLLHFVSLEPQSRYTLISGLYQVLFGYLSSEETLSVHAGAVYGLYLVYFTQPTSLKKIPIRLTIDAWHIVETVYKQAFDQGAADLIYTIRKLRDSNAFVYVAQEEPISRPLLSANEFVADHLERTLIQAESAMQSNTLVPIEPLLSGMSSLAAEYRKAKAGLVSLALARRSSEIVMQQLLRSKPTNMNVKDAKPLPHFLEKQSTLGTISGPSPITAATGTAVLPTTISSDAGQISSDDSSDEEMEIGGQPASMPTLVTTSTSSAPTRPTGEASTAGIRASVTGEVTGPMAGSETVSAVSGPAKVSTQEVHAPRFIRRAGGKGIESTLPSAFPLSMLQSTAFSISTQTEDIVRDYYKHRHLRYEYTGSGGLTLNNNEYPEQLLLANRTRKRELEKEKREEERREKKSEKSKRRHTDLTRKLREPEGGASSLRREEEDGVEEREEEDDDQGGYGAHGQIHNQNDQGRSDARVQWQEQAEQGQLGEEDNVMEEVIAGAQDQDMPETTDAEETQPKGESRHVVESARGIRRGVEPHQEHVVVSSTVIDDHVMNEEHADVSVVFAGIDPQAIEGAESLLGLQKQGLP
ncbi:MAG: small nuclear RNA activating complex, subunit SNAP43-domain-containing protein [Linnemannia gamsii]|nr:MAG: small nuclear RNA activating complex, subunit SNAP43-domain-containing protein [Linnemannia gamsii]